MLNTASPHEASVAYRQRSRLVSTPLWWRERGVQPNLRTQETSRVIVLKQCFSRKTRSIKAKANVWADFYVKKK